MRWDGGEGGNRPLGACAVLCSLAPQFQVSLVLVQCVPQVLRWEIATWSSRRCPWQGVGQGGF